jgi:flagellar P-ring protein precursor FlgI
MKTLKTILTTTLALLLLMPSFSFALRIKDISRVKEVRDNLLSGYGLVIGLSGTGDKSRSTQFMAQNLMQTFGSIITNANDIRNNNAAAVMVTANLSAFAKPGDRIDVMVSSVADAKSLEGGVLLQTQLFAPNGEVVAVAQGSVSVGGTSASAAGSSTRTSIVTSGRVPNGAIVEREVVTHLGDEATMEFVLNTNDFELASQVAEMITSNVSPAQAVDGSTIRVDIPQQFMFNRVPFVAQIQRLPVNYQQESNKVIVNERTGTIVIGNQVRLQPAAIAHGGITVSIQATNSVSQPNGFAQGQTLGATNADIKIDEKEGHLIQLDKSATLQDLVTALNAIGATPIDLITILQALKEAGSLQATLEII